MMDPVLAVASGVWVYVFSHFQKEPIGSLDQCETDFG